MVKSCLGQKLKAFSSNSKNEWQDGGKEMARIKTERLDVTDINEKGMSEHMERE